MAGSVERVEAKGTEFATAVARDRRPVVLTDTGAARWRAIGLWTPQYFCNASDAGVEQVSVPVFQHTCVSLELQSHSHTHTTHHRTRTPRALTWARTQKEDLHVVHGAEPDGEPRRAWLATAPHQDQALPLPILARSPSVPLHRPR